MKKNISVISMDSVLQEWLLQKLIKEPPESDSAKELLSGIYDMISGDVNSLLLSTTKNSEIESLNTKEQIYKSVWSEDYLLDDSNIMAFIRKLRKKIEPNPDEPKYILTIWGIGYKFNEKV